ncbi:MAG: type III ribulose-bisphosphate carboxylase [Candidatus Diapherotrites archaeon]
MSKIEWYTEFDDFSYKPRKDDLVVKFRFEGAKGFSFKESMGRIASESSIGTWTTLARLPERDKHLMAKAFKREGSYVYIAYPYALWEKGNAPQLLSGIAGNIFGMKAVKNLRLVDVTLPPKYVKSFKGPLKGISGIRKLFRAKKRPLTATVPKPKVGYSAAEHAQVGFEAWTGGLDLLKDDENLTSTSFNNFKKRVELCAKMRNRAERITGEHKDALLNITAETHEMERRAKLVADYGWGYAMIDVVTAGTAAVQTLRETCGDLGLAIHAHRAMHAAFSKNPRHGISMPFLCKLERMIGVDQLHIGTVVGKLVSPKEEVLANQAILTQERVKASEFLLAQDWAGTKPVFPVSSGGLHAGILPQVLDLLGSDIVLQCGGGVHGHPRGTRAGAQSMRQSIDAWMDGISLKEYAKSHSALAQALEKWGEMRPK